LAIEWVEGAFKLVMVTIVVLISTLNDWYQDRHFRTLQNRLRAQSGRSVLVIRNGRNAPVPVPQLVVGDVCMIGSGMSALKNSFVCINFSRFLFLLV